MVCRTNFVGSHNQTGPAESLTLVALDLSHKQKKHFYTRLTRMGIIPLAGVGGAHAFDFAFDFAP